MMLIFADGSDIRVAQDYNCLVWNSVVWTTSYLFILLTKGVWNALGVIFNYLYPPLSDVLKMKHSLLHCGVIDKTDPDVSVVLGQSESIDLHLWKTNFVTDTDC